MIDLFLFIVKGLFLPLFYISIIKLEQSYRSLHIIIIINQPLYIGFYYMIDPCLGTKPRPPKQSIPNLTTRPWGWPQSPTFLSCKFMSTEQIPSGVPYSGIREASGQKVGGMWHGPEARCFPVAAVRSFSQSPLK